MKKKDRKRALGASPPPAAKGAVEAHYSEHPYPKVGTLDSMPLRREELNTLAGRWTTRPIPADGRILVAGCGTREALAWALSFPAAEVYACDLSGPSLAISRSLAEQLGITNVRFEQRNLLTLNDDDGLFDVVSSWGVLHHLPEPLDGLKAVRARLRPGGVMHLMLYSRRNRYYIRDFQDLVRTLAIPGGGDAAAKMAAAKGLTLGTGWDGSRMSRFSSYVRDQYDNDPPHWADSFIHPQETDYDLPDLFALLEAGGARFLAWNQPWNWFIDARLGDPQLAAAYASLTERQRWEVADRMVMPNFDLLAGLAGDPDPRRPWMEDDEFLLASVVAPTDAEKIVLRGNVDHGERQPLHTLVFEQIRGAKQDVSIKTLAGVSIRTRRIARTLVRALDGQTPLRVACEAACTAHRIPFDDTARRELLTLTRALIHPHGGLLIKCPPAPLGK